MEILSLLGGAASGFIFKMMAQASADKQAQFEMWMKTLQAKDDSADKAAARVPASDKAGNWTRRIIVLCVLFGVILAPFVLALIDKPIVVEVESPVKQFLGIFSYGGKTLFYELRGYLMVSEIRTALLAIIGFYFGQGVAKR